MKYAALSDLHLGFRGPGRVEGGRNVREMDVERAWLYAVRKIAELAPDFCFIAGDTFHSVRPSFHAVRAFQSGVGQLVEAGIQVVIIPGNHETPRTRETLSPNVTVEGDAIVVDKPGQVNLFTRSGETVSIACLPFVALEEERSFTVEPNPTASANVLLIHAAVQTSALDARLPTMYGGAAAYDVGREATKWDVIACGDFHEFRKLHPTAAAFYSGSIERTSSNIWDEAAGKRFVFGNTSTGEFDFIRIPTRQMSNLEVAAGSAAELNTYLSELLDSPIDDGLVRVKVEGFPRGERSAIDWRLVSELKELCVHFLLDLRYSEAGIEDLGDRRDRRGRSLADDAADFFDGDDSAVRDAAFGYLGITERQLVGA